MPEGPARSSFRVSLAAFPARFALPGRLATASPVVQDAHRQSQFLLGDDLALFEQAMGLQLAVVAANRKLRTPEAAALFGLWSRTYSCLADACTLMCHGSYASCAPLLRTASDAIAAQRSLVEDEFAEYEEWSAHAITHDRERKALAFDLGRFRAGSALAEDEGLGALYRLLTDLSMPHFGSTALQTAPDSNLQKLALTFADSTFHLGWAELTVGWLLLLARAQLETAAVSGIFALAEAARDDISRVSERIEDALMSRRRCFVESIGDRFLIHNFRRTAAGSPRRVIL